MAQDKDLIFPANAPAFEQQEWLDERAKETKKKAKEEANTNFPGLLADLKRFSPHLTSGQKAQLVDAVRLEQEDASAPTTQARRGRPAKKAAKAKKASGGSSMVPKYVLPSGTTWSGRGRTHREFAEWENSAEGKAFRKANPDQAYPINPEWTAMNGEAGTTPAKKATKKRASKKGARKTTKRAGKKAARKAVAKKAGRKTAKKAGRKSTKKATKKSARKRA